MEIEREYQRWLASPIVKEEDKAILKAMSEKEKADAFYKEIEFGTGGMRGILGPGTNRMNEFAIRKATVAFGRMLLDQYGEEGKKRGVAISHDNRHKSREFTLQSADILNQMGFKVYIFDSLRPTPELSYAVRYEKAVGGIMITASHNPKVYNGYKVYDETGCQLVPDTIAPMLDYIASYPDTLAVEIPQAKEKGETILLGKEVDDTYVELVKACQIHPELPKDNFKVIYTPQHGASLEMSHRVFLEAGYDIHLVDSQCTHDPDFSGTPTPNPENPGAYDAGIALAKKLQADLVVTTDPDGDRCGLAYLGKDGQYHLLTGNQSGAMLIDYILSERKKLGLLSKNPVMYDTIVTSSLGREIAASYGVKTESFLTGFKYIGERIHHYEQLGEGPTFEFGYEESYGCLVQPFVRDKDGTQAILLYTEMALFYKLQGLSLGEAFEKLQERFGYHDAKNVSFDFPGPEGAAKMKELTGGLRENPLKEVGGKKVVQVEDYLKKEITRDGKLVGKIDLPESDVIKLVLEDESTIEIRPSGTEPKIKFYVEAVAKTKEEINGKFDRLLAAFRGECGI
ncbi:MAG: phospho-sugar mutase [Bacilli bacterium]|nr:phospho-sugar mutase [Bacilli bacterium]